MLAQPAFQFHKTERTRLVEIDQQPICCGVIKFQDVSVHSKKRSSHRYSGTFVAVHERMVLRETLPKRCGFLNQVFVVTGLRTRQRRLKSAAITDSEGTAKPPDEAAVGEDGVFGVGVIGH
jgi:hypothetical protein